MSTIFGEQELVGDAGRYWWLFLLTGIAWFVFALLVFQWDYTTVYAISYLFGVIAIIAGVNEFLQIGVSTTGWKVVRGIVGVLFVIAGIWAVVHPRNAFATIAALIGFFFLFKGDLGGQFRPSRLQRLPAVLEDRRQHRAQVLRVPRLRRDDVHGRQPPRPWT